MTTIFSSLLDFCVGNRVCSSRGSQISFAVLPGATTIDELLILDIPTMGEKAKALELGLYSTSTTLSNVTGLNALLQGGSLTFWENSGDLANLPCELSVASHGQSPELCAY